MEARFFTAAIAAAALLACGANYRSQNFMVHSASSDQIASEVCSAAETYRRDLALEWLGHELPPWREPCPIDCSRVRPHEGAGGKTSFFFNAGVPHGWDMELYGTRERVLDSVLPHEVTHTIFATHFGRPLPRWADEGGSTTVEHTSERAKQDSNLIHFLKNNRGIAFNRMFAMTEYPRDMLPLYSQGYSLARYLILQGGKTGKQKFVSYVGDGMAQNNWTKATREHYGFQSLSDLQVSWLEWVKQGSPAVSGPGPAPREDLAEAPAPRDADSQFPVQPAGGTRGITDLDPAHNFQSPTRPSTFASPKTALQGFQPPEQEQRVARPTTGGWYARQKDKPREASRSEAGSEMQPLRTLPGKSTAAEPRDPGDTRPPLPGRKLLMEWSRTPRTAGEASPIYTADERNASPLAASEMQAR